MNKIDLMSRINPTNDPLRADVIKFVISLRGEPGKFHATEYIINVLTRILYNEMTWHQNVENYYETGNQFESPPDLFK